MNSFKDFYNDKEEQKLDEEILNEDVVTIVMAVFAIPSIIALFAWAGSLIFVSYLKGIGFVTGKIIKLWKQAFSDISGYINTDTVNSAIREISRDPKTQDKVQETKRNKRAFENEMREVYSAIEAKNFDLAKKEFEKTARFIQNNPDVHKVIIYEISRVLKEPPIYVNSPGNPTYQAIKKVINIRVAKAASYATKITMERNLKRSPIEKDENNSKPDPVIDDEMTTSDKEEDSGV
jgi:hypothetical protein